MDVELLFAGNRRGKRTRGMTDPGWDAANGIRIDAERLAGREGERGDQTEPGARMAGNLNLGGISRVSIIEV